MQVLEGAQYRLRVKLTNEAGEQLPPELFRVYAGAFCPGYAPAHFHAERTAEEWVLTMPGLKPGRVPWNWQVIAAEYATGVEWLLAAGEVTVTPRHATGSGCVDPGELKIVATLDKTTLQMTVQIGESTAACSLAVVAAQNSAKEAANSAGHAAEQAQAARISASAAAESAEAAAQALKENAGGGANSADLTAHTENTEIHVTAAERESWNRTSGNFKVVTEWNEARPIILEDRTAYLPLLATNELSNLWLEPPTPMPETFVATLEFSSGETATRYRGTGITWSGDDVVNGVFVPQANTRYSCVFYYTGDSFCGKVSAERYLSTHVSDTSAHITEDERESWNEKQFTEKEETILKRGVERDFLTRNNTYVFVADENDPNNTLTNRPPLPDMEDEGKYTLKAILNKEVVKEWLGIEASSSSEPMSDKWLVVMTDKLDENTTGMTASDGVTYTSLPAQLSNPLDPSIYTTVQVITCSTAVTANSVKAHINETFAMLEQAGVSAPEVEIYAYPLL